ncbi:GNAT family N-acetyltransferase [Enterococcus sp. BWM-S5]|uniref:GNAT family N-acetyltransferase n=1 Tax=Enterococcus larvae TaxID=2794352 RepID=A0ABS4CGI5_9ENTE|nr:GNAT family N-acetyltransferase [Enterococcus larvae]MBP1045719.1 GNAT family N-acetyltransferase [Enterococcus larvae]
MTGYRIRPINQGEEELLELFLYEAIFQREGVEPLPRSVIQQPELYVYIEDFGKKDDYCLVAEQEDQIVGAVWTRILSGNQSGFGNLDDQTPEFAISVLKEFRGMGIGKALMSTMLEELKTRGYSRASLAVQKDNYALKMYQNLGFEIIDSNEEEYIMLRLLG